MARRTRRVFNPHDQQNRQRRQNRRPRQQNNRQRGQQARQGNNQQNPPIKAPYTFVPVVTNESSPPIFDAVFHQGQSGLYSGELLCELTTLTPLFVGHYQYKAIDRDDVQDNLLNDAWGPQLQGQQINKKKDFREPLFYGKEPDDSPVIVPGASIKGMLRQNIGAMFSAPMERVQEQYFSYRPNLKVAAGDLEPREAVVKKVDLKNNFLVIDILPEKTRNPFNPRQACFVSENVFKKLSMTFGDNKNIKHITRCCLCKQNNYKRIKGDIVKRNGKPIVIIAERISIPGKMTDNSNLLPNWDRFTLLRYRAGIDGKGNVARSGPFNKQKDDVAVIVNTDVLDNPDKRDYQVHEDVVKEFKRTKKELIDKNHGHAKRKGDIDSWLEDIKADNLEENQLIYVEWDTQAQQVVSFGHNFRYRWRYRDSVQKSNDQERPELASPEDETMTKDGGRLTGARLMFGYVDGADAAGSKQDGARQLGIVADEDKDSDAARLAGRISPNAALEVLEDEGLKDRFICREGAKSMDEDQPHRYTIPLKILGQPKASAVEHYIQQPTNKMKTYGDLPGVIGDDTAGRLSGRKFYRHQNDAAKNFSLFMDTRRENIETDQSAFAQFISQPGRKFRFTLRFKDLRDWELGALMLALDPRLHPDGKACANKLGGGRPLGLGSVHINIDEMHLLDDEGQWNEENNIAQSNRYIQAFLAIASECNLTDSIATWLKVLDYDHSSKAAYPTRSDRNGENIYTHHTYIRATYSERRRNGQDMPQNFGEPVKP